MPSSRRCCSSSAGSVIHAMSDEQDMRKMGGIWKLIPWTCAVMWVGNLALAGIPPFAGYYSKDAIISAAYAAGTGIGIYGFICTVLAAFLTAFYSWRLLIMTFHGTAARRPPRDGARARKPTGDDRAAAGPGHRRGDRRHSCCTLVHRRATGRQFWNGSIFNAPDQPRARGARTCAGLGRGGADSWSAWPASRWPM